MTTLTQTATQPQLTKETILVNGSPLEVDLHITDWEATYSDKPVVTVLADLYSTEQEAEEPVPAWSGMVACTLPKATKEAVTEMIRSHGLTAENYYIGSVWKPEAESEF